MDTYCVQCGEPWDYYGARHGDMNTWEYELFRKGAGCPCCEGHPREFEPSLKHTELGDDDPVIRCNQLEAKELGEKFPPWRRPQDKVFWECSGCGVRVIGNVDYPEDSEYFLEYHLPRNAPASQWYNSHPFHRGTPEKEPAHIFGELKVCEFCLDHCSNCGAEVSSTIEHSDVYDEGWCATSEAYGYTDVFCIECIETMCSECNCLPEDCECDHDDEDDE